MDAIETNYSGILFRSRLEARWAMYFDLLGIDWIYEVEAFRLSSGEIYMPDFYLPPPINYFCEVKPYRQQDERWRLLVSECCFGGGGNESKIKLLLLFGKVHAMPCPLMFGKNDTNFIALAHCDSQLAPLYYARHEFDDRMTRENQVFCDDCNSYRF